MVGQGLRVWRSLLVYLVLARRLVLSLGHEVLRTKQESPVSPITF